jgi:tight adherence protein C
LPKVGRWLFPREGYLAGLKAQLVRAGFFRASAAEIFLGVKLLLMFTAALLAGTVAVLTGLGLHLAAVLCVSAAAAGMLAPNLWLERQISTRHRAIAAALPDALDILVLCMEGGISITAAFQRMTDEIQDVHPILQDELRIVQREIQLGLTTAEALQKMSQRCGMDEVRDLAAVLLQSERYGVSLVKALRMHADSWRQDRQQEMEALAQQAAVKILFPTLLCIFPAIFIVLLGPAAFQMSTLFMR